ncbi:hypothetical protein Lal_00000090 [Lupinus albus]|nr:hypothetical protein Lal_00000090 [Lupinus albus]
MWTVRGSQSPLPYAIFITNILKHFNVFTTGETKVALNLHESNINVEVVHKMGFSIDPHDRHTYKHRTDRPTALVAQPESANPNPSEFHAQSSSSSVIDSRLSERVRDLTLKDSRMGEVWLAWAREKDLALEDPRLSESVRSEILKRQDFLA